MIRRPLFFYGWTIVGIAVLSEVIVYGIRHSFSAFFPPILDEFGWSRASTAVMLSLSLLVYGFTAPMVGSLADRWRPKKLMLIGMTILSLATTGCAFANELWHFYLLFGIIMPIGIASCGWPLWSPTLANWFVKKRGLAMSLGQVGGGISYTFVMLVELTISNLGWRHAYFVLGGIVIVVLLPLCLLFFHFRPQSKGLQAYGVDESLVTENSAQVSTVSSEVFHNWTLHQALRTRRLWFLILSQFLFWGVGCYLVLAHQIRFTEDIGYTGMFSASIFALVGIFMIIGQALSSISDWIGREQTITIATALAMGGLVALLLVNDTDQPWLLYLYAVCFGGGAGLYSPAIFAATADIFYGKNFGAISGLLLTGMGIGGLIGPWLGGYIYDVAGSYYGAFVLCLVCLGLSCIAAWVAAPRHIKRLSSI